MKFRIGIGNNNEGFRSIAWALEHPGCYAYGVNQVAGLDGELWSPRKVLRRTLWHERDHTGHIRKLI